MMALIPQGDRLRDYIDDLPDPEWLPAEADKAIYRLLAALDYFRIMDHESFDFRDSLGLPSTDAVREIVRILTAPENSTAVQTYFGNECSQITMNPFAETVWGYIRTRLQRAEQAVGISVARV
ncbi:MAG: hypothetical protein KDN22_32735 [Verrucomicrobiae bacterium]|nr:hypothetical protein [Verrucomicrobiae bacterium]